MEGGSQTFWVNKFNGQLMEIEWKLNGTKLNGGWVSNILCKGIEQGNPPGEFYVKT